MSLAPLLGLPGKAKTMLDRLTATRAANLDNLDAAVTTRAPSSTALSSATYTAARAATIDKIDGGGTAANYTATRAGYLDNIRASHILSGKSGSIALSATTWTTVGTITDANKVLLSLVYTVTSTAVSEGAYMRINGTSVQAYCTLANTIYYSYVEFY